jgi:hypothetical protein
MFWVAFPVDAEPDRMVNLNTVKRFHELSDDGTTVVTTVDAAGTESTFNSLMPYTALKNQLSKVDNWRFYERYLAELDFDIDGITDRIFNLDFIKQINPTGDENAHSILVDVNSTEYKVQPAYADITAELAKFTAGKDALNNSLA